MELSQRFARWGGDVIARYLTRPSRATYANTPASLGAYAVELLPGDVLLVEGNLRDQYDDRVTDSIHLVAPGAPCRRRSRQRSRRQDLPADRRRRGYGGPAGGARDLSRASLAHLPARRAVRRRHLEVRQLCGGANRRSLRPEERRRSGALPAADAPGAENYRRRLLAPRDFDVSPYFRIVKPPIERDFDPGAISWDDAGQ